MIRVINPFPFVIHNLDGDWTGGKVFDADYWSVQGPVRTGNEFPTIHLNSGERLSTYSRQLGSIPKRGLEINKHKYILKFRFNEKLYSIKE